MTKSKSGLLVPERKLLVPGSKVAPVSTDSAVLREQIAKALTVSGLTPGQSYLSYAGILPLDLPDGLLGVVFPDLHSPAHKQSLVWPLTQFLADIQPHLLISIGDLADIFALSRHPKALRCPTNPQWEFEATRRLWDNFVDAADPIWSFIILGNHEDRVYRFLQDMAPQLGGILNPHTREPLSFHSAMGYKASDNITFLYGTDERGGYEGGLLLNNDLQLHHGIVVRPKPAASPLADMDRWMWSIGHGHTHRAGMVAREVTSNDECFTGVLRGHELAMLVDMDHEYMAYAKSMFPNWHYGFGVIRVHNGAVHMQQIPIAPGKDGRLVFSWKGKTYVESDR